MNSTAVIVGASVAGVRTAQSLRSEGFDGQIVLIGAEPEPPYDKPPLSKQFLAGDWERPRLALLSERDEALGVQQQLGVPAQRLEVADRHVVLADGRRVPYDVCVIATGASARRSPWGEHAGLHVLRSATDAQQLRAALAGGGPLIVIGGGFIGAEVAATASRLGCDVTVVDPLPAPLARNVGEELGGVLGRLHAQHDVRTRFGSGVAAVTSGAGPLQVTLDDGAVLTAPTVLVGIGAVPNDGWLESSGLLVDDGVVCDEYCRAVGAPDVYAVGDVARWLHRRRGEQVRVEHWTNAVDQARCVARNIIRPADAVAYEPVEYVWSDQYDWKIQIAGRPARGVRCDVVGDLDHPAPRAACAYAGDTGQLAGVVTLNWPRALVEARRMLAAGVAAADGLDRLRALAAPPGRAGG